MTNRRPATPVAPRERSGRLGRARQTLIGLVVLSVGATLVHSGTFATFNATTTNAATITSGVLLLGNKVSTGSECFSAGQGTPTQTISSSNSSACTAVWNATVKPGDNNTSTTIYQLAVRNVGNLDASTFQLYTSAGTCDSASGFLDTVSNVTFKGLTQAVATTLNGATAIGATSLTVTSSAGFVVGGVIQVDTGANYEQLTISAIPDGTHLTVNAAAKAHATAVAVNGSGLCRVTQLAIARTNATFTTVSTCLYGNTTTGTSPLSGCAYDTTHNLRDFNDNYVTGGSNPGPISLGAFTHGTTQYFIVAMQFPSTSDNGYQGLGASTVFNWFAQQ